jgi:hypothetical protein
MGRTTPTFVDLLHQTQEYWAKFRRALRREDRPHFERLFHKRGIRLILFRLKNPTSVSKHGFYMNSNTSQGFCIADDLIMDFPDAT